MIKVYNVGSEAKSIVLIYPKKINTKNWWQQQQT